MGKKVAIGCDHAGFALKEAVKRHLMDNGFEVLDEGTFSEESCHYPSFARSVAEKVAKGGAEWGVLICGTGLGMAMAANRNKKVRAALCPSIFHARMARRHNDANVLCLGGRITGEDLALAIVDEFFSTKFEGGRHKERIDMFCD
ncbi:MAG: ribose 5-phosphate isomerase B [Myxococcota bacterium]